MTENEQRLRMAANGMNSLAMTDYANMGGSRKNLARSTGPSGSLGRHSSGKRR
jgi:hypothetical protein